MLIIRNKIRRNSYLEEKFGGTKRSRLFQRARLTYGAGTAYSSGAPEFKPPFSVWLDL
jgi:hypothetical protein